MEVKKQIVQRKSLTKKKIKLAWFSTLGKTKQDRLDFGAAMPPGFDNPRCQECGLCTQTFDPFTYPKIGKGKYVFVVNQPTEEEAYEGEMGKLKDGKYPGRERTVLQKYIADKLLGLKPRDYSIIPSVLCRAEGGKKPGVTSLSMCRPFVLQAIGKIKADGLRIVAMGVEAASQMFQTQVKLKDHIGEGFDNPLGQVTVTYSPNMVFVQDLSEGGYKIGTLDVIKTHVKRFINEEPNEEFPKMEVM